VGRNDGVLDARDNEQQGPIAGLPASAPLTAARKRTSPEVRVGSMLSKKSFCITGRKLSEP
jgi:hypothetical protein